VYILTETKFSWQFLVDSRSTVQTPWYRFLLKRLIVAQLVEKLLTFYGIRWFITVLTGTCQWTLS